MTATRRRFLAGAAALVVAPSLPTQVLTFASGFVWVPLVDGSGEALCEGAWAIRHGLESVARDATPDEVRAAVRWTFVSNG